jgi:hypothetical protein
MLISNGIKKHTVQTFLIVLLFFGVTSVTYARTLELYTLTGFVEILIEAGVIPDAKVSKAYELTALLKQYQKTPRVQGIDVTATQYIEYGTRTYNQFEDIEGLVLRVTNKSDTSTSVLRDTNCPVLYTIYNGTEALYTNKSEEHCASRMQSQYILEPEASRIFEVTHPMSVYQLPKGTYRFDMQYLNYGSDSVTVTIK